ncbi:hypothetical protein T4A_10661 [Trichinella pseudospiralis]|uniref:Uncharacterized protein n=1 Tax=Trichinella pseudospiralis TaxID=6337 RepID=A0A0V1ELG9_TRIPS|nr:hypothetical protein T4A_10661 [Trichinella pseudospiralis]KRZ31577.1 hypothetical protein T4C_8203 [Trichinella pseudospiralis]
MDKPKNNNYAQISQKPKNVGLTEGRVKMLKMTIINFQMPICAKLSFKFKFPILKMLPIKAEEPPRPLAETKLSLKNKNFIKKYFQ